MVLEDSTFILDAQKNNPTIAVPIRNSDKAPLF